MGTQPWERARQQVIDQARQSALEQRNLASPFLSGGAYAPERILSLWGSVAPQVAQVRAPGAGAGDPYGLLASRRATDLASRSAAIQAGNAAQTLNGSMNPAARVAALSQIARQAAGNVGQIGASAYSQAYGQGLGLQMQGALSNQDAMNQARMGALSLFGQSVGNTYGMTQAQLQRIFEAIQREKDRKAQEEAADQQAWGNAIGAGVGMLPLLLESSSPGLTASQRGQVESMVPSQSPFDWQPIDYGR